MNIDDKLKVLYDILVDNTKLLEEELISLIANPEKIGNANKFASLLIKLNNPSFISPLLLQISYAEKEYAWLNDYLYAAGNLIEEMSADDTFETPKNLTQKLCDWTMDNTGELAWMASGLLQFSRSKLAEETQLKKLEDRSAFFLIHVNCILGLLRIDEEKHTPLVAQIAHDETNDEKLREFCIDYTIKAAL